MSLDVLQLGLTKGEIESVRQGLGREPNEVEWSIIDAEWSEHSSYKSSKALLRLFPTKGKRVVLGPGYDAGVVDVGNGYVVTLHIESHNHPSAVDPYGGASTGIGGVLRDILSMGTRPVALVDILRFGRIDKSAHARWLFRNVVRGIADYGNCVGVPTVAGDIEFDESFERNCLVDVACVGLGRKSDLILGEAKTPGDVLVLIGGSTGRDGIRGATFASKNLSNKAEEDRSSVQVPDPFMKKLLIDSLIEAVGTKLIRGMKDLGGGGLSTALSEIASNGGTGVDVDLGHVRCREGDMSPTEIMISESQERMLLVLSPGGAEPILSILREVRRPLLGDRARHRRREPDSEMEGEGRRKTAGPAGRQGSPHPVAEQEALGAGAEGKTTAANPRRWPLHHLAPRESQHHEQALGLQAVRPRGWGQDGDQTGARPTPPCLRLPNGRLSP